MQSSRMTRQSFPELTNRGTPPALERIVRRCLEKRPDERFQSARDLAFALEAISGFEPLQPQVRRPRWSVRTILATAIVLTATAIAAFWAGQRTASTVPAPPPTFRQLTFRRGFIPGARFAPDGQTVIYAAAWDGKPVELFTTRLDGPESRPLGLSAGILAISASGEMAVVLGCEINWAKCRGTLAQAPLLGGAPREILEDVDRADYGPDGKTLAVVRVHERQYRLEYPVGKVLYTAPGWIGEARFSPKGDQIAFFDRPTLGSGAGSVVIVDLAGNRRTLSSGWKATSGLAWSPAGDEIWFTAEHTLWAVTLSGKRRVVFRAPGYVGLLDISRQGHVLLDRGTTLSRITYQAREDTIGKDLSWFDWSTAADLSPDRKTILFSEWGRATDRRSAVYLRRTDRPEPVRLGAGRALALSPDARWALALEESSPPQLVLLPTGPGQPRVLPRDRIEEYHPPASWIPDARHVVFSGLEKGSALRSYIQDIDGGNPRPLTDEGTVVLLLARDGKQVVARRPDGQYHRINLDTGESVLIRGLGEGDIPVQWSANGRSLYVRSPGDFVATLHRIDLVTGRREFWKELAPLDPAGVMGLQSEPRGVLLTPDGEAFVYSYWNTLTELYLAEGLK
jgi:eukaryotic-like serine/threonine-protein kinase